MPAGRNVQVHPGEAGISSKDFVVSKFYILKVQPNADDFARVGQLYAGHAGNGSRERQFKLDDTALPERASVGRGPIVSKRNLCVSIDILERGNILKVCLRIVAHLLLLRPVDGFSIG